MSERLELYDLFDTPEPVSTEPANEHDTSLPEQVHSIGYLAAHLYEIDFSVVNDEKSTSIHTESNTNESALLEEEIIFPDVVVSRFDDAISYLKQQDPRIRFSTLDLARIAEQSTLLSSEEYSLFKKYCRQHPAIEYLGDGTYGLVEHLTPDTYWPGNTKLDKRVDVTELVSTTVEIMAHSRIRGQKYAMRNIIGIVKSQGIKLYRDEIHDFMAALASHPDVTPDQNGSFFVEYIPNPNSPEPIKQDTVCEIKRPTYKVRSTEDISQAIKKINRTEELKRAKDLAINKKNTRRRGRNRKSNLSKLQGRLHGKKQTFEQQLAEALKNAPKSQER